MGYNINSYYNEAFGIDSVNRVNALLAIRSLEDEDPPTIDQDLDDRPEEELS